MEYYIYSDSYPSKDPNKELLKKEIEKNLKNTVTNPTQADIFLVLG